MLNVPKRRMVMASLSNLAKFLGVYEDFRKAVRDYGLKWSGRSSDERIIDRLTKVLIPEKSMNGLRRLKRRDQTLRISWQ